MEWIKKRIYGSCKVEMKENKAGIKKKELKFKRSWREGGIEDGENGRYIKLEGGEIMVIDIDTKEMIGEVKELYKKSKKSSSLIVETQKGYHIYYKLNEEQKEKWKKDKIKYYSNVDLKRDGIILCPPTRYEWREEGEKRSCEYKVIKEEIKEGEIGEMPEEVEEILERRNKERREEYENKKKIVKVKMINEEKEMKENKIKGEEEEIEEGLMSLNIRRAEEYEEWIRILIMCVNEKIKYKIFDNFSKRCKEKYDPVMNKVIWNNVESNKKGKITIGTLWYMLKNDNEEVYNKLIKKIKKRELEKIEGGNWEEREKKWEKEGETFIYDKFINLLNKDEIEIGEDEYIKNYKTMESYKYFEKYHKEIGGERIIIQIRNGRAIKIKNKDMEEMYGRYKIGKTKFLSLWKEDYKRICYTETIFNPKISEEKNNIVFNEFRGFKYDNLKIEIKEDSEELKELFLEHIKWITSNDDEIDDNGDIINKGEPERIYKFFIEWIAHIIQKPWIKTNVGICIYGSDKQQGKNRITDILEKLFEGYTTKTDNQSIIEKFNSTSEGAILTIGDEIDERSVKDADAIKDKITRKTQMIEKKGRDKYKAGDYNNFIFTTNHEETFRETDKRFLFIETPYKQWKSNEWYKKLVEILERDDVLLLIYKYFKNYKLKEDYYPQHNIYITNYGKRLLNKQEPAYIQCLKYKLNDYKTPINIYDESTNKYIKKYKKYTARELWNDCNDYSKEKKLKFGMTLQLYAKTINYLLNEYKKTYDGIICYNFENLNIETLNEIIKNK